MLQLIVYLLCVYLVVKGVEVLTIALASSRPSRVGIIVLAGLTLAVCILAALFFGWAASMPSSADLPPSPYGL